jgi:HK97 family phage prohead protease
MSNKIIQYKSAGDFEVKDVDMGSRTLVQAYTRYDVKDSDQDFGRKGMFDRTWSENFHRVKHLLNHDVTQPVGKIEKLWDDDQYAYYKSKIGTHNLGNDFMKMADSGLITEASYGYKVIRERKMAEGNELLEVKLWEVSALTHWGANEFTPVISLSKSMTKEQQADKVKARLKALESFTRNTDATDDTIQLLLLEIKNLGQLLLDATATTTPAAEQAPEPEKGLKAEEMMRLQSTLLKTRLSIQTL